MKTANKKKSRRKVMFRLGNRTIRRIIIALVTVAIAVVIIERERHPGSTGWNRVKAPGMILRRRGILSTCF